MAGFEWYSMLSAGSENGLEKRLARLARAGCAGVFAVPAYEENSLNDDRGLRFAETMIRLCRAAGMKCLVFADARADTISALDALRPDAIVMEAGALTEESPKLGAPLGLWARSGGCAADTSFIIGSRREEGVLFYADDAGLLSSELDAGYVGALANVVPEFFQMLKSALDAGDRVRAENALDFLRVASCT